MPLLTFSGEAMALNRAFNKEFVLVFVVSGSSGSQRCRPSVTRLKHHYFSSQARYDR
jgi:hypothetical protein